jgi:glucoamylase
VSGKVEEHDDTHPSKPKSAPGGPGSKPRWTSSAKTAVGTAISKQSRIWYTIGQGVLNELYFPDIDKANTRTIRFLVTDGTEFFSDEEHDASHQVTAFEPGIPGYTVVSTCRHGRYRLTKEILTESVRDTLLLRVKFEQLMPAPQLKLYVYVEPHLADQGAGNSCWVGEYHGLTMMFAQRWISALAVYSSVPFVQTSCGFVGKNDGYVDLRTHSQLTKIYNQALNGNVGMCGELDWKAAGSSFVVAIALGANPPEAGQQARAGILTRFDEVKTRFISDWQTAQGAYKTMNVPEGSAHDMARISTAVLQTHESKRFPGGFVASLSLPWGFSRGDEDIGAYHVLWPRDLCETAMGLMACGDMDAGRRALFFLACTQKANGSWSQNMWLDGTEHWGAIQMDGIAMPILLADQLRRAGELKGYDAWPMMRNAVQFLLRMGPGTGEDRWEALSGYTTFTMACEIAGLLAAADFADTAGAAGEAEFLRETADAWNDAVDTLTYARDTDLAKAAGVEGYYLRITPKSAIKRIPLDKLWLKLANHGVLGGRRLAVEVLSPDALALVRFGMRSAQDPRIQATVKLIDAHLRSEMTTGHGWIRSTDDGYGEHKDGSPYDGTGIGHCWPLLAGERGHYAVAAGDTKMATEMLLTNVAPDEHVRHDTRAGLERRRHSRAPALQRSSGWVGHAARMGSCGVRQAAAFC